MFKTFGGALFCRVASQKKNIASRNICYNSSVVDLKLNSKCCHMYRGKTLCLQGDSSSAFPGKCSTSNNPAGLKHRSRVIVLPMLEQP